MQTKSSNGKFMITQTEKRSIKMPPACIGRHYEKMSHVHLIAIDYSANVYDLIQTIYYDCFDEEYRKIKCDSQWIEFHVSIGKRRRKLEIRYQSKALLVKDQYTDIAEQVQKQIRI